MNMNVIVLGVNQYSFQDKDSQRLIEGCSVHYVKLDAEESDDKRGYHPVKASLPQEQYGMFKGVGFPQECQASIEIDLGSKKNQLKIKSFKPVKKVAFS